MTGAGGRIGRILRAAWSVAPPPGLRPVWCGRNNSHDLQWDILADPPPALPAGAVVLHLAGVVAGPPASLARNAGMIPVVVAACRAARVRRLLVMSSAAVYAPGPAPADEADRPAPAGAYGQAKLLAETAVLAQADLPVTVLRLGNLPGADALLGPRPGGEAIVLDPVPGRDGGPMRSWIGGRDLAAVLARLCLADLPRVLNLAADPPLTMADLLRESGLAWRYGPPRPGVLADAILSTARLRAIVPVPRAVAADLAVQAAWARRVLAGGRG